MDYSLSKFFPKNTEYFYAFPEGQESNFFSDDPPWKEELFATRPLVCAGPDVKVIVFASNLEKKARSLLSKKIGVSCIKKKNIVTLPAEISEDVEGEERTELIKKALKQVVTPGKLVMAQPFLDQDLWECYQISPELSTYLNDKKNMFDYISATHLPERYALYENGKLFAASDTLVPLPCVVKVSSSASGDGVRMCKKWEDISLAKLEFKDIRSTIIVEKYIDFFYNLGVQFAVPYDSLQPIEIVGVNEQLVTPAGEYLGAIIDERKQYPFLDKIKGVLLEEILPKVRANGWYGVGGFDVLLGKDNQFYFIDSNFRMTAMTAYIYKVKNKEINKSVVAFTGTFQGSEKDFKRVILPLAKRKNNPNQMIEIITLTKKNECYHFNAGLFFNTDEDIKNRAGLLLSAGVESEVLKRFTQE